MRNFACGEQEAILEARGKLTPDRRQLGDASCVPGEARMGGQVISRQTDAGRANAVTEETIEVDLYARVLWDNAELPEPHEEPEAGHWTRPVWERLKQRLQRQSEQLNRTYVTHRSR